jgi:hypothetical protein
MCFICYFCAKQQSAGTSAQKIVTQYRQFQHPPRPKAMRRKVVKNGKMKNEFITDPGGFGLQIAKEVLACPMCAANWERDQRQRQGLLPEGQSAKVILPAYKPKLKEEPERPKRPYSGHRPAFRNTNPDRYAPKPNRSQSRTY